MRRVADRVMGGLARILVHVFFRRVEVEHAAALGRAGGARGQPRKRLGVPERYRDASPAARLPSGAPQLLVHGTADAVVPPSMSERYQVQARAAGDDVAYVSLEGVGHLEVITGRGPAWQAVTDFLAPVFA